MNYSWACMKKDWFFVLYNYTNNDVEKLMLMAAADESIEALCFQGEESKEADYRGEKGHYLKGHIKFKDHQDRPTTWFTMCTGRMYDCFELLLSSSWDAKEYVINDLTRAPQGPRFVYGYTLTGQISVQEM